MEKSLAHHAEARRKLQAMAAQRDLRTSDIDVATALLSQAKINLSRTVIRAPIDGIVIERNVDLGQTVAASLQAPTLFTIAQDLRRMELKTFVDEADIGVVRKGQRVLFSGVMRFPRRYFEGRVTSIRKSPKVVQNVTVYHRHRFGEKPGGYPPAGDDRATTRIVVAARRNVRRLPLASLRFSPRRKDEAGEARKRRDG